MDLDMITLKKERQLWVDDIVKHIFEVAVEKRERSLSGLAEKNVAAGSPYGFIGVVIGTTRYALEGYNKSDRRIPALHLVLLDEGRDFQKMDDRLKSDRRSVEQNLGILVGKCLTQQDIRNALPDILQNAAPWMKALPRTQEEAWPFKDDPMRMEQYEQTKSKIYYYFADRMLN